MNHFPVAYFLKYAGNESGGDDLAVLRPGTPILALAASLVPKNQYPTVLKGNFS